MRPRSPRLAVTLTFSLVAILAGCSSSEPEAPAGSAVQDVPIRQTTSNHPFAQYIELAGFRLSEPQPGKLKISFAAINHSEADLGDVTLQVRLVTNTSTPEDAPLAAFEVRIPNWKSEEVRDTSATVDSELRVYELPDWQFLRPEFDITFPEP